MEILVICVIARVYNVLGTHYKFVVIATDTAIGKLYYALPPIDTLHCQWKELNTKEDKGKPIICILHVLRLHGEKACPKRS